MVVRSILDKISKVKYNFSSLKLLPSSAGLVILPNLETFILKEIRNYNYQLLG